MNVFISYSAATRKWAEQLKSSLEQRGISVWSDTSGVTDGLSWTDKIKQAVRGAEAIIVLVDPRSEPEERERLVWQIALDALWSGSNKRMIPFLLRNAAPPPFTRATVQRDATLPVIRAKDPKRDWDRAVNNLVALLRGEADLSQVEQVPAVTEEDRAEHLRMREEMRAYIESLKADLPKDPAEWRARQAQQ